MAKCHLVQYNMTFLLCFIFWYITVPLDVFCHDPLPNLCFVWCVWPQESIQQDRKAFEKERERHMAKMEAQKEEVKLLQDALEKQRVSQSVLGIFGWASLYNSSAAVHWLVIVLFRAMIET